GMVCLVFGLGSAWRFLQAFRGGERTRRVGRLIAHGALLAMALWLLVESNSATSLACFILGGGLMVVASLPAVARTAVHLLVGTVVFLGLSSLLLGVDTSLVDSMGRDPTLTGRTALWNQLLGMPVNRL